jgi:hypothetical protein
MRIRRIIRPQGVRGKNNERQEYTPSAHGGRLESPKQDSTAYRTAKKERVNRHRNVTDIRLFTIEAGKKYDLGNLFVDKGETLAQQESL